MLFLFSHPVMSNPVIPWTACSTPGISIYPNPQENISNVNFFVVLDSYLKLRFEYVDITVTDIFVTFI